MRIGDVIRQAAREAAERLALYQGWRVQTFTVNADVVILASGDCAVAVRVALIGGGTHCFEYRCDATGSGALCAVETP